MKAELYHPTFLRPKMLGYGTNSISGEVAEWMENKLLCFHPVPKASTDMSAYE
jgi:hypothetical protein